MPELDRIARRYLVEVTVRETFTHLVEASSAKRAAEIVREGGSTGDGVVLETWANGDRQMVGVKGVRRDR